MANKALFASIAGKLLRRPDAVNREGAPAYAYTPRHKLAQLSVTGCLNATFYAEAKEQLDEVIALAGQVEPEFLAKCALYAREKGYMKDMPALLLACLSVVDPVMLARVFPRVVDNGRMLRNFVQIMRSGAVARKSLGSRPKNLVAAWLNTASDAEVLRASVGNDPSLADVIKMVHPKPKDVRREALFGWLIGKEVDTFLLPEAIKAFERFKADPAAPVPDVPFQMLTALKLSAEHWAAIADKAGWHMLRMNLNTFARHGVFELEGFEQRVARRLADAEAIRRARVFPYQLMVAHAAAGGAVPEAVRQALAEAMEIAIANVPSVEGRVVVCPDVSGSMSSPVTGFRRGATTAVRCIDVAALVAAAFVRRSDGVRVLPFENDVVKVSLKPRAGVLENARQLASIGGGGTNCSAPLALLNRERAKVDLVVFVSDNQSWVDARRSSDTGLMREWQALKGRNPRAKLVCIDVQPYGTAQAIESADVLNVGGFSDAVFEVIAAFLKGETGAEHWLAEIEKMEV